MGCASCGGSMKKGGTKKPLLKKALVKAKNGMDVKPKPKVTTLPEITVKPKKKTPFQEYLRTTPNSTPSDTSNMFTGSRDGSNPKLDKAYYDTYYAGQENKRRIDADLVQFDSKGNRIRKNGGSKKPVMRGGGKVATKSTAGFPSVSKTKGVGSKKK